MKITCGLTIIVLLAVVNNVTSDAYQRYEKLIREKAAECKETNATENDIMEMIDGRLPTTRTSKCLNACVMNKFGVMKEEKFLPDQYAKFMAEDVLQLQGNDAETIKKVMNDVGGDCKTVSDPDKCESAFQISSCIYAATKKRGLN